MKRYLLVVAVACASPPPVAPAPPVVAPRPPAPRAYRIPARSQDIVIAVAPSGITLNGARLPTRPMVADVEKLLGKADRTSDKPANIIHTWDRLGILVYEPHDGRAQTIGMLHLLRSHDFDPKDAFAGRISVDGNRIGGDTMFREVQNLVGARASSKGSATFKYDSIEVYVGADAPDHPVRIVELSFYNEGDTDAPAPGSDEQDGWEVALAECARSPDGARCTVLGMRYQHGAPGTRRDDSHAAMMFEKGCASGHAFACTALGVMHRNGRAVPARPRDAVRLFRLACSFGDTVACKL